MSFHFGYRPNPTRHMRTRFGATPATRAAAASSAPPAASLLRWAPPVLDQGQTGSCTGHGTATGLYTSFAAAGAPLPFLPSPAEIYRNARAIDRLFLNGKPTSVLTDDGAMPNQVFRALNEFGVRASRGGDSSSDADPATINDEPTLDDVATESLVVPFGDVAIRSVAQGAALVDVLEDIRKAVSAGMSIGLGVFVDTAFMNWSGGTPMGAGDLRDPAGGGHWLCLIGYETDASGLTICTLRNSWSPTWGEDGNVRVAPDFVAQCTDLTVYAPKLAA